MGLATNSEMKIIKEYAVKINELLTQFFIERRLKLVDFKLEFGRDKDGNIILADEISPDTCRLWDSKTNKKLDKDRFRFDLGEVEESYKEIKKRIS
jgi:phosphoribosylaminoimidazole-succinocarboxamide synthase